METVNIRSLQHYLYCPHRWGLIEIDRAFAENYFVVKANIMHERVHNPDNQYSYRGKKIFPSVPVWNDNEEYDLYGIVDCIEATVSDNGIHLNMDSNGRRYDICIVEYKPTEPMAKMYNESDALQVFAQKICVDYVFNIKCKAFVFYKDTKKRIELPFDEKYEYYDNLLKRTLNEIRTYQESNIIPPIPDNQQCSGCSMRDLCIPKALSKKNRIASGEIKKRVLELLGEKI